MTRRFATNARAYLLKQEIGSGSFGKCFRAAVFSLEWETFRSEAAKNGVSEFVIKILYRRGFKSDTNLLLSIDSHDLEEVLSEAGVEGAKVEVANILKSVRESKCETKEEVAIKILRSIESWDAVRREVSALRSANHPNLINVYCAFPNRVETLEELWIVMPLQLCSCHSIFELDGFRNGIKDVKVLATILRQLLQALVYLHEDLKIHRDVKAANILISSDGNVKLADFGIAANHDPSKARTTFAGTPHWMAPEILQAEHSGDGYGNKVDVWSFGITAMELAHGYVPYGDLPPISALVKILREPPPTCEIYRDHQKFPFPRSFHKLLAACLKKDPAARPSAKKLLSHAFFRNARDPEYLRVKFIPKIKAGIQSTTAPPSQIEEMRYEDAKREDGGIIPVETFILPQTPAMSPSMPSRIPSSLPEGPLRNNAYQDISQLKYPCGLLSPAAVYRTSSPRKNTTNTNLAKGIERRVGRFLVVNHTTNSSHISMSPKKERPNSRWKGRFHIVSERGAEENNGDNAPSSNTRERFSQSSR